MNSNDTISKIYYAQSCAYIYRYLIGELTFLLSQLLLWKCMRNMTLKKISHIIFNFDYKQVIQNLLCGYGKQVTKYYSVDAITIGLSFNYSGLRYASFYQVYSTHLHKGSVHFWVHSVKLIGPQDLNTSSLQLYTDTPCAWQCLTVCSLHLT